MSEIWLVFLATLFGCAVIMAFVTFALARAFRSFYASELEALKKSVADMQFELAMWKKMSQMSPLASVPPGTAPITITNTLNTGDSTIGEWTGGAKTTQTAPKPTP